MCYGIDVALDLWGHAAEAERQAKQERDAKRARCKCLWHEAGIYRWKTSWGCPEHAPEVSHVAIRECAMCHKEFVRWGGYDCLICYPCYNSHFNCKV